MASLTKLTIRVGFLFCFVFCFVFGASKDSRWPEAQYVWGKPSACAHTQRARFIFEFCSMLASEVFTQFPS